MEVSTGTQVTVRNEDIIIRPNKEIMLKVKKMISDYGIKNIKFQWSIEFEVGSNPEGISNLI